MKPILIVAPHTKIEYTARKAADNYDDVTVKLALLDSAIEVVKEAEKNEVEVIISRGGTANLIKKTVPSIPVIEIKVSPYDLFNAINIAKKYGKNIYIIGFKNVIDHVQLLGPILDININAYQMENEEDGKRYIRNLVSSGEKVDAILGGTLAENLALEYNIPTVFLETSTAAIDTSINEAKRILKATRNEKEKSERFKSILQYINEGVISIDSDGKITTFNSAARKIMKISGKDLIGLPINEITSNTKLIDVMEKNKPILGQILLMGKTQVLANILPIVIKDKTVGAVATFQDISKIQEYEQRIRAKFLDKGHVAKYSFSDIIGNSDAMVKAIEKAKKYCDNNGTILITGESGTGKEMFAQSIHKESPRKNGPFVAVNCAAIPKTLLESELFGYEEGAFTGARRAGKSGLFAEAHGGTIFLDEIGEIDIELQPRLLRVLQEREIRPVGSTKVIPIDIRIIAATNKNLLEQVEQGAFRSDLYYRLNILKLKIPALRNRNGDIELLSKYFVNKISAKYNKDVKLSSKAINKLKIYDWPGNIRELENVIENLVVLCDDTITEDDFEELMDQEHVTEQNNFFIDENAETLEDIKKKYILKILSQCDNNQTLAAEILGISRTHLWRLLNNYQDNSN
ncbi:sigma 54-interacting transcriptional regulator [Sedimentibacter saalensis]|uniref:PAS domain S-box-containing protein n=1 Tax=Sedimentibacter saalensis TaxID=130788 RepID=A0A562JIC3_9FIRM|nr:sigma 54-interacting transcriptional regulator [Sedimentibacter saalensis]TWH82604.1 PAS domain S-box-containing protein [Sedimentibacter saalensis]